MRLFTTLLLFMAAYASQAQTPIVINELMARNTTTAADQDGEFDDWIEIHNLSADEVDISGHHLSDNPMNLDKFPFPEGTVIPANGYLIVWADEDGPQDGLHANFKLSGSGEELFLLAPDTLVVLDQVEWGDLPEDVSYARLPNGTGPFAQANTPTFNTNNNGTAINELDFESNLLSVYPNPANGFVYIQLEDSKSTDLTIGIYNTLGQRLVQHNYVGNNAKVDLNNFSAGLYFFVVNERFGKKVLVK